MKRSRIGKIVGSVVFAVVFIGLMGYVVMRLWNATLPLIIQGVSAITFWQALALLLLSRLLFGGFRGPWNKPGFGGFNRDQWKSRMAERWQQLTPEQRERMRQRWGRRCGSDDEARPDDSTKDVS
ncbi:hypothetical protein [uncultured Spirosoma sp.]|uniref:hypothetical protein n=1 Tax=uncultured Spirosoma sp. TaxID=278208 RepID=UPI0025884D79|nr:hypothetical protein [uncultured Spirosoma sp.]